MLISALHDFSLFDCKKNEGFFQEVGVVAHSFYGMLYKGILTKNSCRIQSYESNDG